MIEFRINLFSATLQTLNYSLMSEHYRQAGVDIAAGDTASSAAAAAARSTFAGRAGKIGAPVDLPGGFAGALDFGDFYLVQCCDTVGTKIDLCKRVGDYSQLGHDLLAMVADDAVCLGAEVVSLTNTFETDSIRQDDIATMMQSLAAACRAQQIVIAGGEIAEVGAKIDGTSWGADAVGIVAKDKVITGKQVQAGDAIIALEETGFRCNGYSLVRKIIREYAPDDTALMQECITGSRVYHKAILAVHGRYGETAKATITGIAHITGGGIPGNLNRILKKRGLGARLDGLFAPPPAMQRLQALGSVPAQEFYQVWNGGNGMLLTCPNTEAARIVELLEQNGAPARVAGEVISGDSIELHAWNGEQLSYPLA